MREAASRDKNGSSWTKVPACLCAAHVRHFRNLEMSTVVADELLVDLSDAASGVDRRLASTARRKVCVCVRAQTHKRVVAPQAVSTRT